MNNPTPYDSASAANPEAHPWGFFSVDPWVGGAGVFLWFETPQDLLATVRVGEPALYLSADDAATAALHGKVDNMLTKLDSGEDAHSVLAELDDACEATVLWVGQLEDLLNGADEWATERRVEFRSGDVVDDAEVDSSPISADERADFVQYIREYVVA